MSESRSPVDRSQLEEARGHFGYSQGQKGQVVDADKLWTMQKAVRALLSAPTVRWCSVHQESFRWNIDGYDECWAYSADSTITSQCNIITVALVPVEDT